MAFVRQTKKDWSMITIEKGGKLVTLINVFTVTPEKQMELIGLLTQATASSVRLVPGFVAASLHRSLDGRKVTMYAQWRSIEDYQAMRQNAAAVPYLQRALAIATFDPGMYEVVETFIPDEKGA
jgi:quinol monooxygenase YgiN